MKHLYGFLCVAFLAGTLTGLGLSTFLDARFVIDDRGFFIRWTWRFGIAAVFMVLGLAALVASE